MSLNVPDLPFLSADQEEQLEEAVNMLPDRLQDAFKGQWESFSDEVKETAGRAAKYAGKLTLRKARGEDISYGQRQLRATFGSLTYAGVRDSMTTILDVVGAWWEEVMKPLLQVVAQQALDQVTKAAVAWVREEIGR